MTNYFKALLPVTTVIDLLAPPETPQTAAVTTPAEQPQTPTNDRRFLFCGVHHTAWMKIYIVGAMLLSVIFAENILEDATFIKARIIDSGQQYRGLRDLFDVWDRDSLSFRCIWLSALLLSTAALFAITLAFETPYPMMPLQFLNMIAFCRVLASMALTYMENISVAWDVYHGMDAHLARLHRFRVRDFWFSPYRMSLQLPQEYDPLIKNIVLILGICLVLFMECFIERVMQFYGYTSFLEMINRPFVLAYRRWEFQRRMARRRDRQKARIVRRYQNPGGNFSYAQPNAFNWSMHTAIGAEGPDNNNQDLESETNWSVHTAIEGEGGGGGWDEAAERAKDRRRVAKLGPPNAATEENAKLNKTSDF